MNSTNTRREFLQAAGISAAAIAMKGPHAAAGPQESKPAQTALPRWRGFNLLSFFQAFSNAERSDGTIREDDCRWMRDWGFDFIRIPMDYSLWNFRGSFGILDSGRQDVEYEDWHGHKLDRKLLAMLQKH